MKLKSGRGFKERFRTRREERRIRRLEGTKPRTPVDYGSHRYGGDSGTRSSAGGI
jgi:hypothetical protein